MLNHIRSARIMAIEDCTFVLIPPNTFLRILKQRQLGKFDEVVKFLSDTVYFNKCRTSSIYHIQYYFEMSNYIKGQILCLRGDEIQTVYIIKEGEFEVYV